MGTFAQFIEALLQRGEIVYASSPTLPETDRAECVRLLSDHYQLEALNLAGPPIPFDSEAALAAAWFVALAGWYLVSTDEPSEKLESNLKISGKKRTWISDFSADIALRFAATIYRRAFSNAADDTLTRILQRELLQWPLSGVLADISDEPSGDLAFGGHPGLQMLYAERLAANPKPHWTPNDGRALQVAQWVEETARTRAGGKLSHTIKLK
jgi:hypothetical protein